MHTSWKNAQTRAAFYYVLTECWDDPRAYAAEWLESMTIEDARAHLAKQLREDVGSEGYRTGMGCPFLRALLRPGWRRIDWDQVARVLLQTYGPPAEEASQDDDDGGLAVDAS